MPNLFPTTPTPDTPYITQDSFRTITSPEYDSGLIVYKSLRNNAVFNARLVYGQHSHWSDIQGLYDFFVSCKGMATAFDFRDFNGYDKSPTGIRWPKLYVGVGTGSTFTFDVPMYASSSAHLFINGTENTSLWTSGGFSGAMWKLNASGVSTNGRDNITFATAPTAGQVIEWQAVGQRMVTAHFTGDSMSFSSFVNMLCSTGLEIRGR